MYVTASEYNELTGKDASEATDIRIQRASLILDARLGTYPISDSYKLDLDKLSENQKMIVKDWVSQMISYLFENNDSFPSNAGVTLGKFSVTALSKTDVGLPDSFKFVDAMLVSAGLIKRKVLLK